MTRILTEEEWDAEYGSFHDSPIELDSPIMRAVDAHHVWTAVDTGSGGDVNLPGFRMVNRYAYWLTLKPWVDGDDVQVVIHPDEDQEGEDDPTTPKED